MRGEGVDGEGDGRAAGSAPIPAKKEAEHMGAQVRQLAAENDALGQKVPPPLRSPIRPHSPSIPGFGGGTLPLKCREVGSLIFVCQPSFHRGFHPPNPSDSIPCSSPLLFLSSE